MYINEKTGEIITDRQYRALNSIDKLDFVISAGVAMATDSMLTGAIVGGSLVGGIVGGLLGDIFD